MAALGRGLASLIPRRDKGSAEDIIEQIDSMEEVEEPPKVRQLRGRQSAVADETSTTVEVEEETEAETEAVASRPATRRRVTIVEEEETSVTATVAPDEKSPALSKAVKQTDDEENILESFEDLDEEEGIEIPAKPNVTPLTIDPETGNLVERVVAEEATAEPAEETDAEDLGEEIEEDETPEIVPPTTAKRKTKQKVKPKAKATKAPAPVPEAEDVMSQMAAIGSTRMLGEKVEYLALGDIEVNPLQPRRVFDKADLEELKVSLDQHGMLQPMVVIKKEDGTGYQIIAGERRFRAAKELGWDEAPVVVRDSVSGDRNRLELALTENVQRQNLNAVEEAMGYQRLNEEYGMSHEEIGQRVGKSRVGITNMIRLLQLPAEIQRGLMEEKISVGHARAILMIPDEEKQLRFYQHILDEGITVRKAENRARRIQRNMKLNDPMRQKTRGRPALALKYDGQLQDTYDTNVRVKFDSQKNRFEVVFHAYNEGECETLINKLLQLKAHASTDADLDDED